MGNFSGDDRQRVVTLTIDELLNKFDPQPQELLRRTAEHIDDDMLSEISAPPGRDKKLLSFRHCFACRGDSSRLFREFPAISLASARASDWCSTSIKIRRSQIQSKR
jgi:hypothetical protein